MRTAAYYERSNSTHTDHHSAAYYERCNSTHTDHHSAAYYERCSTEHTDHHHTVRRERANIVHTETDRRLRVGVVVPVLNEVDALGYLFGDIDRALAHCTQVLVELIVVDGGSHDDSCAVAQAAGARVVRTKAGRARQMTAGVGAACDVDALVFVHADTRLPVTYFSELTEALTHGALWGFARVRLDSPALWARTVGALMNLRSSVSGLCTGDQTMYMRCSVYQAVGGMPRADLMEDIRLATLLGVLARPRRLHSAVQTSTRRWRSRGVLRTVLLMWTLRLLYWCGADPRRLQQLYR